LIIFFLELIEVGKKQRALETLLEVVKSRRHRTWTKTHEPLMEKLLDLCVDLKKSLIAKDGLHQYKTIAQTVRLKIFFLIVIINSVFRSQLNHLKM
jgi:translation initiation factor 3 subunit A